jgi:magnesium-transporting ATPase (P-type)
MRIHHLSADDALASLHTSAAGLTHEEAARRLAEFGPNQVAAVARRRWWLRLVRQFTHFFALILWLAAALAFIAEYRAPGQGMSMLGVAILGVIVINGLFSFWQEYRAERTLTALQQLLPQEVRVLRDGELAALAAAALVPGDVIYLEGGDHIPADCRLIEAFGVRVNIATITGESLPKARTAAAVAEEELIHARNVLLAGTLLVAGEAKAAVIATGMHTEFGKIAHLTQATGKIISPLQQEIARLSRWVALLATGLGVVFFALGQSLGLSFWANFIFAIGIIVANVPEGLLPTVTLALAIGAQRMARRNALIRHLPSVETLGSATVICTDKTGTLTENRMQVRAVYVDATLLRADDTAAWASPGAARRRLLEVAAHCHSLKPAAAPTTAGDRPRTTRPDAHTMRLLGDPLEVALVALSHAAAPALPEHPRIDELPFDSERRRMSTLHQTPEGLVLYAKGALEALLPLCCGVQRGEGIAAAGRDGARPAVRGRGAARTTGSACHRRGLPSTFHARAARAPGARPGVRGPRRLRGSAAAGGAGSGGPVPARRHQGDHGYWRSPAHGGGDRPPGRFGARRPGTRRYRRTTGAAFGYATAARARRARDPVCAHWLGPEAAHRRRAQAQGRDRGCDG